LNWLKRLFLIGILAFIGLSGLHGQGKSIFDLRGERFEKSVELDGEWDFFWNQLIEPGDSTSSFVSMTVPSDWYDNDDRYSRTGFATYRTTILLDKGSDLGIYIPHIFSSYKLMINGSVAHESGKVGETEEEYTPYREPRVISLRSYGTNEFEIIIQAANFNHLNAGLHYSLSLGKYRWLQRELDLRTDINLFLAGGLFITGFVLLAFAFTYKQLELQIPFYALFSISLMYRMLGADPYPLHSLFPGLTYTLSVHLEYLSIHTITLFGGLFIFYLFPKQTNKYLKYIYLTGTFLSIGCVLLLEPIVFTGLLKYYLFFVLIYVLVFIYIIARARIEKEATSGFLLWALVIVAFWTLFQIINFLSIGVIPYYVNVLLVSMIIVFCNLALFRTFMLKIQSAEKTQAELSMNKTKQTMLSLISHEIKTPVSTLQMNLEMLKVSTQMGKTISPSKMDKMIVACSDDVDAIKQMVNDFVYFMSRADTGVCPTQVGIIAERLKERFSIPDQHISLIEGKARIYETDLLTLEYIISTLLNNAERYSSTEDRRPELTISEQMDQLIIEVKDYGIGMDEAQVKKLGQSKLSLNENSEISGVGFYLAKELSNQLNHQLIIESEPGLGTSVRIELKAHD